ncbi:MAG TPA: universal stress protein [Gaiellaceae bacterium]|jgi:nucleotide-binding universal stress UspA family protein|nr:universal stress protein [Gaiellaceae bacterium]
MKRIVIATDGSTGAGHALEQGYELAAELGADVSVVYVRHAPAGFLGAPYYQDVITDEAQHARGVIADAKLYATHYDVDPDYEVIEGDPAEAILDFAQARDADVIVIGSRGLGRVTGALLGSVSREIVQRADRPVLVAKARAAVAAR